MLKYVTERNLKEFLESHNLSQAEFARRIGVAPSVITRIVKGEQGFDGMKHVNAIRLAKEPLESPRGMRPVSHLSGKSMIHHHKNWEGLEDFRKNQQFLITSFFKVLKNSAF